MNIARVLLNLLESDLKHISLTYLVTEMPKSFLITGDLITG